MKANFTKRLCAFILDIIFLSIIFSLVTFRFVNNANNFENELDIVLEQYENSEITVDEYNDKVFELNYESQKSSFMSNMVNVVLYVGYFVIFGYLNNGKTLGKKICKIKVVDINGNVPSIWRMFVRSLFIYGLITLLFSVMFVYILNVKIFTICFLIVTYVEIILMMITFFMILYRKDRRGLHDMIAKTNVIEEVK